MTHVVFAAADAVLLYLIALRSFGRADAAVGAALLLLITPSHVFGPTASEEGIRPLPFVLGWALGLTALVDRPSSRARWMVAAGTASLLASAAAQPSAVMMIPVFGMAMIVAFRRADEWRLRDAAPAIAVVASALLVAASVGVVYADRVDGWFAHRYGLASMEWWQAVPWQRTATGLRWFWNFYLPSHLFLTPDAPGWCGMFLTPTALPIAVAASTLFPFNGARDRALQPLRSIVVAGCIGAPLAAAFATHPPLDDRALIVVPLGVLLATYGAMQIWKWTFAGRVLVVTIVVAASVQAFLCLRGPV